MNFIKALIVIIAPVTVQSVYHDTLPYPFPIPTYPEGNRTAIIISGEIRSGNITFISGDIYEQRHAKFFGPDDPVTPIQSILDYIIAPFALFGGVDLFIYIPIHINNSNPSSQSDWDGNPLTYEPYLGDTKGCELYSNHRIFHNHTNNKVYCITEVATRLSNQFFEGLKYWKRYYFQNPLAKEMFLQQEYGKFKANLGCKQYSLLTGVSYRFKIRLRPDLAAVKPFPDISSFIFRNHYCPSIIYHPSPYIFGVAAEDSFNFGEVEAMDKVLDRYMDLLTVPYKFGVIKSILRHQWNSEAHLLGLVKQNGICLIEQKDIWIAKMRVKGYERPFRDMHRFNSDWTLMNP